MADFTSIFFFALAVNVVITFRASAFLRRCYSTKELEVAGSKDLAESKKHQSLLRKYLVVFLQANLAEWIQGPYVYALYDSYGYSHTEIAVLFVASFGSSMIFGSFIGGMADWAGRRRFVVLFAIIFATSCTTKHFKAFNILMWGSLLSGVARSLLFSVFEAWMIRSHSDANLGNAFLEQTFSWSAYGNSIIAILAGLVADAASNSTKMKPIPGQHLFHVGGFLNAFDIAVIALIFCGICCNMLWEENYGDKLTQPREQKLSTDGGRHLIWCDSFKNALTTTLRTREILLCGTVASLFEGSMYIFVFMWTPALTALNKDKSEPLPFGLIFSTFMVASMAGSSLFSILIARTKGESLAVGIFVVAAVSMMLIAVGQNDEISLAGMLLFEMCVGMYFPVMGTLKGAIVPEDKRSAIYNLYRIPVNLIVIVSLLANPSPKVGFALNGGMLLTAAVLQIMLKTLRLNANNTPESTESEPEEAALLDP